MMSERTLFCSLSLLLLAACGEAGSGSTTKREGPSAAGSQAMAGTMQSTGAAAPSSTSPVLPSAGSSSPILTKSDAQPIGDCRAGHYIGSFMGDYHSGAWFGGEETIMFSTMDVEDRPGFEFWLEKVDSPCMPGQEFCADAVVKGGKLRGFATPFADANDPSTQGGVGFSVRFEIDLTGELDCRRGMLRGRLENGCYDILSVLYRFDGTIQGDYSLATSAFTTGDWQVKEMPMDGADPSASPLGGSGMWSADHKDDSAAPSAGSVGLCAGQSGFDTP